MGQMLTMAKANNEKWINKRYQIKFKRKCCKNDESKNDRKKDKMESAYLNYK